MILTHNRPDLLAAAVTAAAAQVDTVLVVDNASTPPVGNLDHLGGADIIVWHVPDQPPNLARMWNDALTRLALHHGQPRYVAMLCDDTTIPPGWMQAVTAAMDATGAVAGCSNPWGHQHDPRVKTAPDHDIMGRMPGWAFVLDTKAHLRADETMRWWWLDTDLDFQARQAGGMVMIGGFAVPNHRPGEYTNTKPELGEQAGRDREAFVAKWGWAPW